MELSNLVTDLSADGRTLSATFTSQPGTFHLPGDDGSADRPDGGRVPACVQIVLDQGEAEHRDGRPRPTLAVPLTKASLTLKESVGNASWSTSPGGWSSGRSDAVEQPPRGSALAT